MSTRSAALARVQEFVGKLYSTILLLDGDDRYFGTGQPGAAEGEYDGLHAQFFEDMAALRQEIQNGRALAAIVREVAARDEEVRAYVTLATSPRLPNPNAAESGQLLAALTSYQESLAVLLDAAKELRGDGDSGGQEGGGEPPRP